MSRDEGQMLTLETTHGLHIEHDFMTGEIVEYVHADVRLSSGPAHVTLEMHANA